MRGGSSARRALAHTWRSLSPSQRRNLTLAGLLFALALLLQPLWRQLQPEVAVGAEVRHEFGQEPLYPFAGTPGLDPWGRPRLTRLDAGPAGRRTIRTLRSLGPDGVDHRGRPPLSQADRVRLAL